MRWNSCPSLIEVKRVGSEPPRKTRIRGSAHTKVPGDGWSGVRSWGGVSWYRAPSTDLGAEQVHR